MMGIHMQIALARHVKVDPCVLGKGFKHVIEESHPGLNSRLATAVEIEACCDLCFPCFAYFFQHHLSFMGGSGIR